MADEKENKPSIFKKALEAGESWLESQIYKAQIDMSKKEVEDPEALIYSKAVTEDVTYKINSQGYKEKPHRIMNSHLKQMALKDSVISAIIQTRQNQVSNHSRLVRSEQERGFMVVLRDEESYLRKIKEELAVEVTQKQEQESVEKSDEIYSDGEQEVTEVIDQPGEENKTDDELEEYNWELDRKAKEKLDEQIRNRRSFLEKYILNCGKLEQRPWESEKWDFDAALRAWVRDTLTYDLIATEIVPDHKGEAHHWFPVDASTIKFSSPSLKKFKYFPGGQTNADLLYPEKHLESLEERDALELDEELLEKEAYKFVQVVNGKIERAYTPAEMKVGIRNRTTDIYNNGYGVSELELMISLVSSHLNTEYYNKAYFTQGFSARGILHLKAPIPRRKLETIRQQWHHMVKGAKNSWQTPIFAGMDEVNWIPLTQNHSDIEFHGWLHYLIKVMCAIYQIDPQEIGIGMKEEGGKGGGLSGDNTSEKIDQSKDKGLYPLLRFLENYINKNILWPIDEDFCVKFTGISAESNKEALDRQNKEVTFKKTVNEIRAEDGLPPLPGMDNVILNPVYFQWYDKYSKEAKEAIESGMMPGAPQQGFGGEQPAMGQDEDAGIPSSEELDQMLTPEFEEEPTEEVEKSLSIEYYKLEK